MESWAWGRSRKSMDSGIRVAATTPGTRSWGSFLPMPVCYTKSLVAVLPVQCTSSVLRQLWGALQVSLWFKGPSLRWGSASESALKTCLLSSRCYRLFFFLSIYLFLVFRNRVSFVALEPVLWWPGWPWTQIRLPLSIAIFLQNILETS